MASADVPVVDGLCLWQAGDRALYRTADGGLVGVMAGDEMQRAQADANRASMHPEVFVPIRRVWLNDGRTVIDYGDVPGVMLADYVVENFGDYMAEEDFALDLVFQLTEAARVLKKPLQVELGDIFLSDDGRVLLLQPAEATERSALNAAGELLYRLLTREDPRSNPGAVLESREINGEISTSAETMIRRCVQGAEGGGYGSVASLRHAIVEVLRARGHEAVGGRLRDFRRHRPRVEYETHMRDSLAAETAHIAALREGPIRTRIERVLHRLFGDPDRVGLRPLWIPLILGYLVLVAPFMMARMSPSVTFTWMGVIFVIYWGLFIAIHVSYRRHLE